MGECSGPVRRDEPLRLLDDAALVVEADGGDPLIPGEPGGARDLPGVEVAGVPAHVLEQVVVDVLVDAAQPLLDVPVLDPGQLAHHPPGDPGLLPHLAHRRLGRHLPLLDVPLGELPAAPALGGDEEDLASAHDQAAGRPVALGLELGLRLGLGQLVVSSPPELQDGSAAGSTPTDSSAFAHTPSGSSEKTSSLVTGAVSQSLRRISATSCPAPQPA